MPIRKFVPHWELEHTRRELLKAVQPQPLVRQPQPPTVAPPKAVSLRQLEAQLYKIVRVTTAEIETEGPNKGDYVWRDEQDKKWYWSTGRNYRYENHPVETVAEADEVMFLCPLCFVKNGGAKGTHHVMVSFANRNVPDEAGSRDADGKPSRWNASGTSIDDLVLTPSILLDAKRKAEEGCHWHGFVGSSGIPPGHAG